MDTIDHPQLKAFAETLAKGGVLDAPAKVAQLAKAIEDYRAEVASLKSELAGFKDAVADELVAGTTKHAKALRKVAEALVTKKVKRIKARKTGDDSWELEVESE